MKILLLGEYSNVHATLAYGLRQLGHKVTVASNGDFWKDYKRDINLSRKNNSHVDGIRLWLKVYSLLPKLRGYDIVQLINPLFIELKAERLFPVYNYLRRHNGKMVLGAFGMDWYWVNANITIKPLRYSDFNMGDELRNTEDALRDQKDWFKTEKGKLNKMIAQDCDGIVTCLYEYQMCYSPYFPDKTHFIPLPIKLNYNIKIHPRGSKIKFFIGINKSRSAYKGTDIMLEALNALQKKYPDKMDIVKAENVPFEQYQQMMEGSDCILDQLYSYTPAMNALVAMSKGIIAVGGGEEENYQILGEEKLRPIINVLPNKYSVYHELEKLILQPERIDELKKESVDYVDKYHDYLKIAKKYEEFYNILLDKSSRRKMK